MAKHVEVRNNRMAVGLSMCPPPHCVRLVRVSYTAPNRWHGQKPGRTVDRLGRGREECQQRDCTMTDVQAGCASKHGRRRGNLPSSAPLDATHDTSFGSSRRRSKDTRLVPVSDRKLSTRHTRSPPRRVCARPCRRCQRLSALMLSSSAAQCLPGAAHARHASRWAGDFGCLDCRMLGCGPPSAWCCRGVGAWCRPPAAGRAQRTACRAHAGVSRFIATLLQRPPDMAGRDGERWAPVDFPWGGAIVLEAAVFFAPSCFRQYVCMLSTGDNRLRRHVDERTRCPHPVDASRIVAFGYGPASSCSRSLW